MLEVNSPFSYTKLTILILDECNFLKNGNKFVITVLKFRAVNTLQRQQQQQNFINKQIKLQKCCSQLARLFEEGQCVQPKK